MSRGTLAIAATLLLASGVVDSSAHAVPAGQSCGGFVGAVCDGRLWCDPLPGCLSPFVPGVCVKTWGRIPYIYKPVCGCNGKTYGNDYQRRAVRVPKAYDGKCG